MDLSRFAPEATGTPDQPRPVRWPRWWWQRLELSPNTHRSFAHAAPLTRGWLHLLVAVAWPVAVVALTEQADGARATAGALAFGGAMQVMLTASAVTHLTRWGVWTTEVLFRLDHVGIFLAIAGTITPFALLVVGGGWGWLLLGLTIAATLVGVVIVLRPQQTPVGFANTSFITLGAVIMPFLTVAWTRMGPVGVALLLGGAAVYVVGAILLAYQRPRLWPRVVGYHEVWHAMVVLGVALHYVMIRDHILPLA